MSLLERILRPSRTAAAHCDGPCGVYDPASARIAAEAVLSMARKLVALEGDDLAAENTRGRYIAIKEEQAQIAKQELLILWTDYFKPPHIEANPDLHATFWNAAKLCSQNKVEVNVEAAEALVDAIHGIHDVFWASKNRADVPFYTAG